jgi:hypothetical protein
MSYPALIEQIKDKNMNCSIGAFIQRTSRRVLPDPEKGKKRK